MYEPNKELRIKRANGDIWKTNASCIVVDFDRQHYTRDWIQFTFVFEVVDPFFYGAVQREVSFLSRTGSFVDEIDNLA